MKHLLPIVILSVISLAALLPGITVGVPSEARLNAGFGDKATIEKQLPTLELAMQGGVAERSEFKERDTIESFGKLAKLSPYFDAARSYNPDEFHTFKVLASMYKRKSVLPQSYAYGNFYFYQMGIPLGVGYLTGILTPQSEIHYLTHPEDFANFYLISRYWIAFYALGTVILIYLAGVKLDGKLTGFSAAASYALLPIVALAGKSIKADVPVAFWSTLALYLSIGIAQKKEWKYYLFSGAAIGCAAATKYTGVTVALIPLTLSAAIWFRDWKKLFACGAISILVFVLLTPAILFDFNLWLFDLQGLQSGVARAEPWYLLIGTGVVQYTLDNILYAPYIFIGLLIFVVLAVKQKNNLFNAFNLALLLFFVFLFAITCMGQPNSESYLLPSVAALAILSGLAWSSILRKQSSPSIKMLIIITATLLILNSTAISCYYNIKAANENIRLTATKWVNANIPTGSSIGMRRYPVSYRSLVVDPEKYELRNELENGKPATLEADYYIDCSFEWDQTFFWNPPHASTPPGYTMLKSFGNSRRKYRKNYFYEVVYPVFLIYKRQ